MITARSTSSQAQRGGWRRLAVMVALFGFLPFAGAHDPMSSWCVLRLRPEMMELTILFSAFEARFLVPGADPEQIVIDETSFPRFEEQLREVGKGLFLLSVRENPVAARECDVVFTTEQDVEFTVRFPRPGQGRLRLHAAFLQRMSEEHVSILSILNEKDRMLAGFSPMVDEPDAFLVLPPRVAP